MDKYFSVIDTLIEKDPHVNYNVWKNEVNVLKKNIRSLHSRFFEYVNQIENIIDTSDYSTPFTGNGKLVIDCTNNFEFTPQDEKYRFCSLYHSKGSDGKVIHSVENPIWGTADMLLSFIATMCKIRSLILNTLKPTLKTKLMLDILDCKEIRIHLALTDSDTFGLAWEVQLLKIMGGRFM